MQRLPRGYHDILVTGLSAYLFVTSMWSWVTENSTINSMKEELSEKVKDYHLKLLEDYNKVMEQHKINKT